MCAEVEVIEAMICVMVVLVMVVVVVLVVGRDGERQWK